MASGDTLLVLTPDSAQQPSTGGATYNVRGNRLVLEFDQTTGEQALFTGIMPSWYSGVGGIDVITRWAAKATTGNIDVDTSFEDMTGLDIDTDSFAAAVPKDNNTVPGVNGQEFSVTNGHSTAQIDAVAAGDPFRLKVARDAASDTLAADAQLIAVELREQ